MGRQPSSSSLAWVISSVVVPYAFAMSHSRSPGAAIRSTTEGCVPSGLARSSPRRAEEIAACLRCRQTEAVEFQSEAHLQSAGRRHHGQFAWGGTPALTHRLDRAVQPAVRLDGALDRLKLAPRHPDTGPR